MSNCGVCTSNTDGFICRHCLREIEQAFTGSPDQPASMPELIHDVVTIAAKQDHTHRSGRPEVLDEELSELEEEYGHRLRRVPAHLRTTTGRVTLPSTPDATSASARKVLAHAHNVLTTWARRLTESRGVDLNLTGGVLAGPVCAAHRHDFTPADPATGRTAGCGLRRDPETGAFTCSRLHCAHPSCQTIRREQLGGTATALCRWFLRNLDSVWLDEAASEIHREITRLRERLQRSLDNAPAPVYAGPCRTELDGTCCVRDLYARPGEQFITCDGWHSDGLGCGSKHDPIDREQWLADEIEDALVTLPAMKGVVSSLFGLTWPSPSTVRSWRFRGRLQPRGLDRYGEETFRGGDVLELVRDRNQQQRPGPKTTRQTA